MGEIESKATKQKAKFFDDNPGISSNLVDVTVFPDGMLLSLASKYDINMGKDREEQVCNLAATRSRGCKGEEGGVQSQ